MFLLILSGSGGFGGPGGGFGGPGGVFFGTGSSSGLPLLLPVLKTTFRTTKITGTTKD